MTFYPPQKFTLKNNVTCIIRSAVIADAKDLLDHLHIIVSDGTGMVLQLKEATQTVEEEEKWIQKFVDSKNEIMLVAEVDGKIVGNLDTRIGGRERVAHTSLLGVSMHPDWRGVGVGSALFIALFDWVKTCPQIEKFQLNVFADNAHAIAIYKKFGFVQEGYSTKAIKMGPGVYKDDISMGKFI